MNLPICRDTVLDGSTLELPLAFPKAKRMPSWRAALVLAILFLLPCSRALQSAELNVVDGVVLKFGAQAQLVVRDKLSTGKGVVLTSVKDDSVAGQSGATAQAAASGDWQGLRVERSANLAADDVTIRYAGALGAAAMQLRGYAPASLNYLQIMDSATGLRLLNGASPRIDGGSFLRNGVGIDADGNALPIVSNSQFAQNTTQAILNRTPVTVIQALGNWWGHASGPHELVGNPLGQGDTLSTGVNYGNWLSSTQLINPSIRLAAPASFTESTSIRVLLSCVNASEYRIAENATFSGVDFKPMVAQADVTLSPGDGVKSLYVQYRDASGKLAVASLAGGIRLDAQGPALAFVSPVSGSVVNHTITVEANASDPSGIVSVQFYVNDVLQGTHPTPPYTFSWATDALGEGDYTLKLVAYDGTGHSSVRTQSVSVSHALPPPDSEGPIVTNLRSGAVPLINGATLSGTTMLTLDVSDRSGVGHVDALLDGQPLTSVSSPSSGSSYTLVLNIDSVANGPHTLRVRAYDSLNNISSQDVSVTVAHTVPNAPTITQPSAALSTRDTTLTVIGSAQAGKQVQVLVNGTAAGAPVTAATDGRFSAVISLVNGANPISAVASDTWGTSAASATVTVTVDSSVPQAVSNLTLTAQAAGKIHLVWTRSSDPSAVGTHLYRASSPFGSIGEATRIAQLGAAVSVYDDLPPADGLYYYRAVSVNALTTPSAVSNQVQGVADNTMPFAASITYLPTGKTDPATGRVGQGRVDLVVVVNEALAGVPYLSLVPQGGVPIAVDLTRQDDTHYNGSFVIDANTPSGIASTLFSARDLVGNRGTEVKTGASLKIDTQGPLVTAIAITPASPIKADGTQVSALFTLSKAMKSGETPNFGYRLSGVLRNEVALSGISAAGPNTWRGVFTLPADAGLGQPETLVFTYRGIDDLDNVSTKITAANRFQVYQGALPPLAVPLNLKAEAKPGGKIRLSWLPVDGATAYQIYRQAPGEPGLSAYQRSTGADYLDSTTQDGQYTYTVASVRVANGDESLSGQSAPVQATASATPPSAPQNLGLELVGQGVRASWQPPLGSTPASYSLYRSNAPINSTTSLTPIKTDIKTLFTVDPAPSPSDHYYAVTALDSAGNESALSNSAYLNFSLLPVRTLQVEQIGDQQPVVSWTAGGTGAAGYDVYVSTSNARVKLNSALLTDTRLTDTGFAGGERSYTVVAVDASQAEMARDIVLPNINTQVVSGLPLKRGIMNKVQVQVANLSLAAVNGLTVVVKVGGIDHRSSASSFNANETRIVSVVVGGYDTLANPAALTTGVEIVPAEGELVRINRTANAAVTDANLVVGMSPESFTRGGVGKIRLNIENTSEVDVDLLTASNNGNDASPELRFKLLDRDGNVLATQPYKQVLGANVLTLANGQTVARIASGASYTSDVFNINVPAAAPNTLIVRLDVDQIHYHTGESDQVAIKGSGSEKTVSLADTAYTGELISVSPQSSFGDVDIVIVGRAVDRGTGAALANTPLKLVFNQQGFERVFDVVTDVTGGFTYIFKPTATDAGLYQLAAVHPAITDRPLQKQFVINRVSVGPTPFKLTLPRNYSYSVDFRATAGAGTSASGLRLVYEAQYQPLGSLPTGITVQLPTPINIVARQNLALPVVVAGDNTAQPSGIIILKVLSNESGATPIGTLRIDYVLSEAKPVLSFTPSYLETGLAQGGNDIQTLVVENKGLTAMNDVVVSLTNAQGGPAPDWVSLSSAASLGSIAVGEKKGIDVSFAPTAAVSEGIYEFRLTLQGGNIPTTTVRVFASITQSGIGNVQFKVSDLYTATPDKSHPGQLIQGLAGARIVLQNEAVASQRFDLATDALGEAYFQNLPAGRYTYRASAANHQELGGRLQVKPGITLNQGVFLDYNLITVEWSVNEVTIQDRYEITLKATYETDVPAPVVVLEPSSINLPSMKAGDVYYGQLNLTNYGLVRADEVRQAKPKSDAFFRFEFLVDIPASLEAKQRVSIPYRVVALQSLDQPSGTSGGGGCYSYSTVTQVSCSYVCANSTKSSNCGSSSYWYAASNSTCPAGGGGGVVGGVGGVGGGGPGGVGGVGGGASPSYTYLPGMPACVNCDGAGTKPPCATCGGK